MEDEKKSDFLSASIGAPSVAAPPEEFGGHVVLRELYPDQTYLAVAPGGRQVVLKMLDDDCLLAGQLHHSVRDRLARVREVAHAGVANLFGVERDAGRAYMVWEYVDGITLDQWAAPPDEESDQRTPRDLPRLARELILAVQTLHARGIVHGSIHARNVILTPKGKLRLIDISPFLYHDVADDIGPLIDLLRELAAARGETDSPLGRILELAANGVSLNWLSSRVSALIEVNKLDPVVDQEAVLDRKRRRSSLAMALAVAAASAGLYFGVRQVVARTMPPVPAPPEARGAAMP